MIKNLYFSDHRFKITGELTQLGNQKPYFSITAEQYRGKTLFSCGCLHEEIVKVCPDLIDFVKMHLSDIDGVPMHYQENGYYWLMKSIGDLFTEYPDKDQSPEKCFKIFCDYLRISEIEGREIQKRIINKIALTPGIESAFMEAKKEFFLIADSYKPLWKKEADMLIKKYQLSVIQE